MPCRGGKWFRPASTYFVDGLIGCRLNLYDAHELGRQRSVRDLDLMPAQGQWHELAGNASVFQLPGGDHRHFLGIRKRRADLCRQHAAVDRVNITERVQSRYHKGDGMVTK